MITLYCPSGFLITMVHSNGSLSIVSAFCICSRGSLANQTEYGVVAIHPDRNLVFIVQYWNWQLISYDMDSKEVRALGTL